MDIFSPLGIPNIRTTKVGSRRDGVEIVEAVVRLDDRLSGEALGERPGDRGRDDHFLTTVAVPQQRTPVGLCPTGRRT